MKIETKINPISDKEYVFQTGDLLITDNGLIIVFHSITTENTIQGTVLVKGNSGWSRGHICQAFDLKAFKPFYGNLSFECAQENQ